MSGPAAPSLTLRLGLDAVSGSLSRLLAACSDGSLTGLPAVRAHQGPAARDLVAKLMVYGAEAQGWPDVTGHDELAWYEALLALSNGEASAWTLIAPPSRPAFLQSPVPDGAKASRPSARYADELDVLSTAKSHDQKGALSSSSREDWFWSLISGQTQDGFLGAGNYGVARMNGGFSNRTFLHAYPAGISLGARLSLDAQRMLDALPRLRTEWSRRFEGAGAGHKLLWLLPWGGEKDEALSLAELDPLFIEVCRRVRLIEKDGRIEAQGIGTAAPRVEAKAQRGALADPSAPLVQDTEGVKAVGLTAEGLNYKKCRSILFGEGSVPPLLADLSSVPKGEAVLVFEGLARGQGKTEGYHHRAISVPAKAVGHAMRGTFAAWSEVLSADVALAAAPLRRALFSLFQNEASKPDLKHGPTGSKVEPFIKAFDAAVDERFFEFCWAIADRSEEKTRRDWRRFLWGEGRRILLTAVPAAPSDTLRGYLRLPHAERFLEGGLYNKFGAECRPKGGGTT